MTTRRPIAEFAAAQRTRTTVQVFDPAGRPDSDKVVVGRAPRLVGRLRASPWANAAARRQAGQAKKGAPPAKPPQGEQAAKPGATEQPAPKQDAPAEVAEQDRESDPATQEPIGAEDLYARFGPNIIIHGDNRVTKTFYVDKDTGLVLEALLELQTGQKKPKDKSGTFEFGKDPKRPTSVLDSMLGGYKIVIQRIAGFDTQSFYPLDPRKFAGAAGAGGGTVQNDLVLVTSSPDGLEAFEQTMDLFYRSVPQILIEAKVVEIAWGDTLDIGVSQVDSDTPTVRTTGRGSFIRSLVSKFPNTATQTSNSASAASGGLLTIGGIHDNLELNAALDLLQTKVKSDIVSHPKIAVRNGGLAVIDTTTRVPYPEARIIGNNTQTSIKFATVGVSMQIRPSVVPGETVVLQIFATVDAITGFAQTEPIPTPEISTRRAVTSVHVPSGKTTVIGGLITKTTFENASQVPILGDIPLLGYLFRSTFIQKGSSEVVFMITPRIIYGFEGSDPLDEDYTSGGF